MKGITRLIALAFLAFSASLSYSGSVPAHDAIASHVEVFKGELEAEYDAAETPEQRNAIRQFWHTLTNALEKLRESISIAESQDPEEKAVRDYQRFCRDVFLYSLDATPTDRKYEEFNANRKTGEALVREAARRRLEE